MPEQAINPNELLHRAIKPNPLFWDTKKGGVTSALFKDSKGVSVDRNANRSDNEIQQSFLILFSNLNGEARLYVQLCLDNDCRVENDATESNPYHALILGKDKINLTDGQARKLAKNCQIIEYDEPQTQGMTV